MPIKPKSHEQRLAEARGISSVRMSNDSKYDRGEVSRKIHQSSRWTAFSKIIRKERPLCEDPFLYHKQDGVVVASESVHHIEKLELRPDLAFTRSNVMSVCNHCHVLLDKKAQSK